MYKLQIKQQNKLKGNNGIIEKVFCREGFRLEKI